MLAMSWYIVKIYGNITVAESFKNTRKENVWVLYCIFLSSPQTVWSVSVLKYNCAPDKTQHGLEPR